MNLTIHDTIRFAIQKIAFLIQYVYPNLITMCVGTSFKRKWENDECFYQPIKCFRCITGKMVNK